MTAPYQERLRAPWYAWRIMGGQTARGVDYMTRSHPLFRIAGNASLAVRRRQYEWFRERVGGLRGKRVLDHGATPDTASVDSNCFLRWLLEDGAQVDTTSPEDISHLAQIFPGVRVLAWPPQPGEPYDIALSSSVLQHVGDSRAQVEYVRSVLAFAPCTMITTPNRAHWLEFHTKFPLLHWLPKDTHRAILRGAGMAFWADERNLNLLRRSEFARTIDEAARAGGWPIDVSWFAPRFLGAISHLVALVERR